MAHFSQSHGHHSSKLASCFSIAHRQNSKHRQDNLPQKIDGYYVKGCKLSPCVLKFIQLQSVTVRQVHEAFVLYREKKDISALLHEVGDEVISICTTALSMA